MRQNKVKQQLKKVIIKVVVTIVCVIMVVYTIVQAKNKNLSVAEEAKKTNVETSQRNINDDVDRSIGNKKYIRQVYRYLHENYGLSAISIAGILGNWTQESGIDPIAVQGDWAYRSLKNSKNSTHDLHKDIGFAQWSTQRRQALISFSDQKYHGEWWLATTQLEFMTQYDGSFVTILKNYALNDHGNVVENAINFNDNWEVSPDEKGIVEKTRGANAKRVYEYMKNNNMTGGADISKIQQLRYLGDSLPY
ncbi:MULTISPECIES: phage tail tip lysozyme [Leuconostoc]|uniref:phage tail tip lysozyme n=1 Tax=Leuconostoc TaxID=1243 RepID=UPI001F600B54|nr:MULTISPECIES: phage tail tip lysozyme [Leuconostoc]